MSDLSRLLILAMVVGGAAAHAQQSDGESDAHAEAGPSPPSSRLDYNLYSLSADASSEIGNDRLHATLVVQAQNSDPARLAGEINETMGWALAQLEAFPEVRGETRDYQTWPRYENDKLRRLIGWTARQTLALESDEFETAAKAIQQLQSRLQVQGMRTAVQPETRRQGVDDLIGEALEAFQRRAERVQQSLGASGFRVVEVDIQTNGGSTPYQPRMEMASRSMDVAAEPAIAGGSSVIQVTVRGRIQLSVDSHER